MYPPPGVGFTNVVVCANAGDAIANVKQQSSNFLIFPPFLGLIARTLGAAEPPP
jgi:hypothetical protein